MDWRFAKALRWQSAASILCMAILAGCGGGGGDGGGSAPPPAATAPTITAQPQSQAVTTGSGATFTVTATGIGTLSYQWSRNGAPIAGATSATYSIPTVELSDSGASFTVVVSNSGGQVTSSAAVLTANANPEGLYIGTLTNDTAGTTWPVFAIALEDGTFAIFAKDHDILPTVPIGIVITGAKISPAVGNFTTTYEATTQPGYTISGETRVSGSMTGTVAPGVSITGTYASSLDTGSFAVNAIADYSRAASLVTIAGTYHYGYAVGDLPVSAETTVNEDGTATVSDNAACSGPSTYAVPDPLHNVYRVTNSAQCPGETMPPFVGLGAFFPAGTGGALNGGVNFKRDTFVAVADNGINGFMIIGSK